MTKDEIIRMAREAGFEDYDSDWHMRRLERFAALVTAHERETCAKLAENWDFNVQGLVKAIRARGENK